METTSAPTTTSVETKQIRQWRCDICRQAKFSNLEEATQHEKVCAQQQQPKPCLSIDTTTSKTTALRAMSRSKAKKPPTREVSPDAGVPRKNASKKNDSTNNNTNNNTTTKNNNNTSKPAVHSFFAPRKSNKRTTQSSTNNSKSSSSGTNTTASTASSQKKPMHSFFGPPQAKKAKTNKKSKTQQQKVDLKAAEETATALAAMIDAEPQTQQPLAGLFANKSMQQLIREQKQAEFLAKRRAVREQDLERKKKPVPVRKPKPDAPRLPRLDLDLAFPSPSHVIPTTTTTTPPPSTSTCTKPLWMDLEEPSSWRSDQASQISDNDTAKLVNCPADLDASTAPSRDLLHEAFAQCLTVTPQSSSTSRLWTDQYGLQGGLDHHLVGASAQQAANRLQAWMQDWCTTRHQAVERMKERQRKLKKKPKKTARKTVYKDETEEDDDYWTEALDSVYLLTGPSSSGKTALVHAVAKACQCPVLEINTTKGRGATALKHTIQGATQSCSTSDLFQQHHQKQKSLSRQSSLDDSDSEDKKTPQASLTVLLMDEVDIMYESKGDAGFWPALLSVAKSARCPIVLTATTVPPALSIPHQHVALTRPTPAECATKIVEVSLQEGFQVKSDAKELEWIAEILQCDIRKLLLELQLYVTTTRSSTAASLPVQPTDMPPSHLPATSASSTVCRPRPLLQAVVPNSILCDQYSTITLHGKGFRGLLESDGTRDVRVRLGKTACRARVLDDQTILVLCPPCPSEAPASQRVVPVTLESPMGQVDGSTERCQTLCDGSTLQGTQRFWVEYLSSSTMDDDDDSMQSSEDEFEFGECLTPRTVAPPSGRPLPHSKEVGDEVWAKALAEEDFGMDSDEPTRPVLVTKEDQAMVAVLDQYAGVTALQSDAAWLQEGQSGLPDLAGACKGFGFDLTEEGGRVGGGKLRLNDNCRPPSEERLYTLGWKDQCFFFGAPETYLTHPGTMQERRRWKNWMQTARGACVEPEPEVVTDKDDDDNDAEKAFTGELEGWKESMVVDEEDMFLPKFLPLGIEYLPQLLQTKVKLLSDYQDPRPVEQMLAQRQRQVQSKIRQWMHAMFDCSRLSRIGLRKAASSSEVFFCQYRPSVESTVITEVVPSLGRMAALEDALDSVEADNDTAPRSSRRGTTTRRRARNARKHYLDEISRKLELDEAFCSTTELARAMAKHLLTYSRSHPQSSSSEDDSSAN